MQPNFLSHFVQKSFAGLCVPVKKNSFTKSADSDSVLWLRHPVHQIFLEKLPKKTKTSGEHKQGGRKSRNIGRVEDATQRPFMVNEVKLKTVSHFSGDSKRAMIISAIARICCRRRRELNCTPTRRNSAFRVTNTAFGGSIDLDAAIRWTFICNVAVANQFRSRVSKWDRVRQNMCCSERFRFIQSIASNMCHLISFANLTLMLTNAGTYIVSGSNKARQVRRLSPCHLKPLFVSVLNFPQIFSDDAPFSTPFQEFSHSSLLNTPQITRGIRISVPWFVT